jgi:hypothetical protein
MPLVCDRELFERHRRELRVDPRHVFAHDLADGRIPAQLSFLHQHGREGGRHRLGVGAEMEAVVDCHLDVGAEHAHADRAGGDDHAVLDHGRRERGQAMLGPHRLKRCVERRVERARLRKDSRRKRKPGASRG